MELLLASAIGTLTAAGIYLILRLRTFPVIVGTAFLSYAVNLFLFASGRLARDLPPIIDPYVKSYENYADPLPQALVLTAIVIGFGMTAVVVLIALGAFLESDTDDVNTSLDAPPPDDLLAPQTEPEEPPLQITADTPTAAASQIPAAPPEGRT